MDDAYYAPKNSVRMLSGPVFAVILPDPSVVGEPLWFWVLYRSSHFPA